MTVTATGELPAMLADVDRTFIDTNVLLAATDEARADHDACLYTLHTWPQLGITLYASGQIFREYLVVATRPRSANGLDLEVADAIANIAAFTTRMTLLDETGAVHRKLIELVGDTDCRGKQIHDANVVATMLTHGIEHVATGNAADFTRFVPAVHVLTPQSRR